MKRSENLIGHENIYNEFQEIIFPADKIDGLIRGQIQRIEIISTGSIELVNSVYFSPFDNTLVDDPENLENISKREVEIWRLKQGLPIGKGEVDLEANPFELGLINLVDLNIGCYVGQEVIAKLARATFLRQELRLWNSEHHVKEGSDLFD